MYRTVNPATNEVVKEFTTLDDLSVEAALVRGERAFAAWRQTDLGARIDAYRRFSRLLEAHAEDLARAASLEMGKPIGQARAEVLLQARPMMDFYADHSVDLLSDRPIDVVGLGRTFSRREPVGIVLGIGPWNGPFYQAMRVASPNLILGNAVLCKPAPICAGSSLMLDRLFDEAGFPVGLYQTVLLSNEQVAGVIADERVRGVTFTGSDSTGRVVGAIAAAHVKPAILELGGSDPFIVLDSADPVKAAANAVACRMFISGQVCCSPKRLIVTEGVADAFTAAVCSSFRRLAVGDQMDEATEVGPLSSVEHAERVQAQLDDAIHRGATVLVGGGWRSGEGAFFDPVVLTDITADMRIYGEEVFGPVAMIYRVPDDAAAVELANATKYGLGGTVFGEEKEALRVASLLDAGMIGVNAWLGGPVEVPFGGTKASGYGRELGLAGMDAFSNLKTYSLAS